MKIKWLMISLLCFSCSAEKESKTFNDLKNVVNKFEIQQGIKPGTSSCPMVYVDKINCSAVVGNIPVNFICFRRSEECMWREFR